MVVAFLRGTTTFALHLFWRTTGGSYEFGVVVATTLLMSAFTKNTN